MKDKKPVKAEPAMGDIPIPEKRSYTIGEIQEILGITKVTALKLVHRNVFHTVKVGNRIRISKKSFDEWLDGKEKKDACHHKSENP